MRWRLATGLILSAATLNGCSCDPPMPVLHQSPSGVVNAGKEVTFDITQAAGEPGDNVDSDSQVSWDLDGDGSFETKDARIVHRRFDAPGRYKVTVDVLNLVFSGLFEGELPVHGYDTRFVTVAAPGETPPANKPPTATFTSSPNPG